MKLPSTLLLNLSFLVLQTQARPSGGLATRQAPAIQWGVPCVTEFPIPIECGSLVVPLDYTNESDARTLNLELLRYKSTAGPFRGSILTHWGGPGPSGRDEFVAFAPRISASVYLGGSFSTHADFK
jgi:hypothetical protein